MERVNVINGDGSTTNTIVNDLLDSALEFYGNEYEDIVIQAIRDISFYEVSKNENMDLVIGIITGYMPEKDSHKYNPGCFVYPKNSGSNCNYEDTILYRSYLGKDAYLIIAHELFGHGVCSRINRIIENNGKLYNRNGIALHGIDNNEWNYKIMNEGCIDFIAESIVLKSGIKSKSSEEYSVAKQTANVVHDVIGKDNFLKAMVSYSYDMKKELDDLCGYGYFDRLSELNDKRYKHEAKTRYLTSYVYKKKIQKELNKMA